MPSDQNKMKKLQKQQTIRNAINCSGVGLHSGEKVTLRLLPAAPGTGIVFRRTDIAGRGAVVPATWQNSVESPLCTTLVQDGVRISTVEHLMSALAGLGVDNCRIEINAGEVPVMDGSAAPFLFLLECAGLQQQDAPRRAIRILKDISDRELSEDGIEIRAAYLTPSGGGRTASFEIDFPSRAIGQQGLVLDLTDMDYKRDISRARTFGFLGEVECLRQRGLVRGGSLENAVVISGDEIMNEDGLRYEDEFVRHKLLDSIGDLYLASAPILGHYRGIRSGHAQSLRLLRNLFSDNSNWEWCFLPATEAEARLAPRTLSRADAELALA